MKEKTHKEISSNGGKARARNLSAKRRKEIARMGGLARRKQAVDNSLT